ncbi:segregation/condensation protein A [Paenibacillus sp. ACRRX]|uniref:segregation and condensation protein A n=1 Tax=unclassified Paenibacillus TaxID=185978 RepID=UPI001EF3FD96|nr:MULTISPECIES: segregation/condensation protein A [unclassified Paenibacillus]MCG7406399.1 segregation/condensation protein A [Paenibacillus sp. ACRRX]MDK8179430.1 segregation/condensation protein A [Paenibacillus sp. UMB4589-SE434]
MSVTYKLQSFEGPLDLLLHLIDKAEINIQDISISEITDQYLEYLHSMHELELEVTSEFLVMAATLLSMKSKQLLPKPPVMDWEDFPEYEEEEYDPREELIRKLIEYRKYKGIAEHLREKETERSLIFSKEAEDLTPFLPSTPSNPVEGLHVDDLIQAFQRALRKAVRRTQVATIHRDEISVKDRIRDIVTILKPSGKGSKVMFSNLLHQEMSRHEIVVTFLALLELMKLKQIRCYQDQLFEDIVIQWHGELESDGISDVEVDY